MMIDTQIKTFKRMNQDIKDMNKETTFLMTKEMKDSVIQMIGIIILKMVLKEKVYKEMVGKIRGSIEVIYPVMIIELENSKVVQTGIGMRKED